MQVFCNRLSHLCNILYLFLQERHIEEVRQKAMSVNNEENCKENFSG